MHYHTSTVVINIGISMIVSNAVIPLGNVRVVEGIRGYYISIDTKCKYREFTLPAPAAGKVRQGQPESSPCPSLGKVTGACLGEQGLQIPSCPPERSPPPQTITIFDSSDLAPPPRHTLAGTCFQASDFGSLPSLIGLRVGHFCSRLLTTLCRPLLYQRHRLCSKWVRKASTH